MTRHALAALAISALVLVACSSDRATSESPPAPRASDAAPTAPAAPDAGTATGPVDAAPIDAAPIDAAPIDAAPADAPVDAPVDAAPARKPRPTKEQLRRACLEKCEQRNRYTDCADADGMTSCPCHCP